ncbi:hypothetical protein GCM10010156_72560 [Planobispora rosea]|uniref:Polymerase nucleotidyl transferase domain-containing protein n=1 Tax=Planobispora rosea TaxID=35762 RepID=A0A8J3SBR0_PLARO|nr:nucleotidyltransferase domain-containing protein [Planobispora rosea]GGT04218.1 hypothetical protein GCM10010156_72560 [Planobispora rosea]GIH88824.1 hypothetical protein Pro02_72320 [Planobispora rosea]
MTAPPAEVLAVTDRYLALADAHAPGLVDGLYLVGSLALDDYRPGRSDIDFVARMSAEPTREQVAALGRAHAELAPPVPFDGVYVTAADLRDDSGRCGARPYAFEGAFKIDECFETNPAVWQTLAQCPVVLRGGPPHVHTDPERLAGWTRGNLRDYWRGWRELIALSTPEQVGDHSVVWTALGTTRLCHTLATGLVTSKSGAGRWAQEEFGPLPILAEALRLRAGEGSAYPGAAERRQDLLDYLDGLFARFGIEP